MEKGKGKELHLYYDPISQPCRTVLNIFKIANVEFKHHIINIFKGEQHKADFKKLNPLMKVPVLVVGKDVVINDSAAIIRYICDSFKVREAILPRSDLIARAKVDALIDYNASTVRTALNETYIVQTIILPKIFKVPAPRMEHMVQMYTTKIFPVC